MWRGIVPVGQGIAGWEGITMRLSRCRPGCEGEKRMFLHASVPLAVGWRKGAEVLTPDPLLAGRGERAAGCGTWHGMMGDCKRGRRSTTRSMRIARRW